MGVRVKVGVGLSDGVEVGVIGVEVGVTGVDVGVTGVEVGVTGVDVGVTGVEVGAAAAEFNEGSVALLGSEAPAAACEPGSAEDGSVVAAAAAPGAAGWPEARARAGWAGSAAGCWPAADAPAGPGAALLTFCAATGLGTPVGVSKVIGPTVGRLAVADAAGGGGRVGTAVEGINSPEIRLSDMTIGRTLGAGATAGLRAAWAQPASATATAAMTHSRQPRPSRPNTYFSIASLPLSIEKAAVIPSQLPNR